MAGKSFKRALNVDPIWFDVPADPVDGVEQPDVRFHCNDDIPGGVMFNFAGKAPDDTTTEESERTDTVSAARDLFDKAIKKDQRKLFWQMLNGDPEAPGVIGLSMMMDIAEYLSEAYSARPTGGSSGNGSPKTSNGSASMVGASNVAPTYSVSQLTAPTT